MSKPNDSDHYGDRKKHDQNFTVKEKIENRQNQVYIMDLQGVSNEEISEKFGMSLSTVEKDLHEMRKNYKKRLKTLDLIGYRTAFLATNSQLEEIQKESWRLYRDEKNVKTKTNLLRLISETAIKEVELLKHVPLPPMDELEMVKQILKK